MNSDNECDEGLMGFDTPSEIILVSNDKVSFPIAMDIAIEFQLVKSLLSMDPDEHTIEFSNVNAQHLKKVVDYLVYHSETPAKEIPRPLPSTDLVALVGSWDADFVDMQTQELFEFILVVNYLDIQPLLNLCCAKVASLLKGKSPDEIKVILLNK